MDKNIPRRNNNFTFYCLVTEYNANKNILRIFLVLQKPMKRKKKKRKKM